MRTALLLLLAAAATSSAQDERSRGPASAPVTVIEYCDFQCPVCAQASLRLPRLLAQAYGSKVRFVYRDFPLTRIHPDSTGAAEAAACAQEQGRFWQMHDLMFANQRDLAPAGLARLAAQAGLNAAAFNRCLGSPRARWKRDVALGQSSGVSATPTFVINGRRVEGIRRFEDISSVIDEALGRSAAAR